MSGFYAGEGRIGQTAFPGSVEITAAQYAEALNGMTNGKLVTIDGGFAVTDPPVIEPPAPEPGPEPTLFEYAAQKRWEKEVGGITVNGAPVATDDRSKLMIVGARIKADTDPSFTTQWKGPDGSFIALNAAAIITISDAVLEHVNNCFAIEDQVLSDITAGVITTTTEIDTVFQST